MNSTDFKTYKRDMRVAIRAVLSDTESGRLDEAAFPAYSHPNPLINWLFWKRLHKTMAYIERHAPYERALDFGCGSGVLLPFLSEQSTTVIAADLDLHPLESMRAHVSFPTNITTLDLSQSSLETLEKSSYDLITALDVLEHVEDLGSTLDTLLSLLKPGGKLVISGPTENVFYKIGRAVAGKEYSGDYHERGIAEIRTALAERATIGDIGVIFPVVNLFDLFVGMRK
jgi:2-polyprenyl-3-methyl-5-hydroxy-6-metoxy-1,4-benzoquinol methylase